MRYRVLNNGVLEFFDATANTVGSIGANGANMKITANTGVIELGNIPSDIQVGTVGTLTNWTFLGGGTIGAGGIGTISMGQSGDTVNMNVSGVVYQYPSSFLRFNEISGANNKINITTQVPGSVILTLPNRPVVGALTLTDNIISTSNTTGTLTVGGGIGITGNVNVSNTLSVRTESGGNIPFVMQPGIVGISGARFGVAGEILDFYTIGSPFNFATNGPRSATQFVISNTGSAVNYLQVTGAVTGQRPTISAQGSDTHIGILLAAKGTTLPTVFLGSGGSTNQFVISNNGAGTNYLETSSAATGVAPVLAVQGSDTNVGINLLPKGNGSANITSTANSTSNTSGALVIRGGMGITGNLFMSAANNYSLTTTDQNSYRLGWTDNYFTRSPTFGGMYFTGTFLAVRTGAFYVDTASSLIARGVISNDSGNNTVLFAGSSPVRLQNTAASTSNTTGSLIVGGGLGVSGSIFSNSYITSTENTNYVVRLDGTGFGGSGPRLQIGTPSNAGQYLQIGAYNDVNNFETTNRNFRLGSTTVTNIMLANATTGVVTFANNVIVNGSLTVVGNVSSENVQSLSVSDPLIQLGIGNYTTDLRDIGFAAHYNAGTNAHTGLIRDSGTKEYYLFQGYTPELSSNNNVIISDPSFGRANLNANIVRANLVGNTISLNGLDIGSFVTSAFNQANVTIGVDTTQNTRLTVSEGVDLSQNVRIDYSNTALTVAQGVDNSQNVRIDYSNTAITIIQGTNTTQNTNIAATDGKMQMAYNTANNAVANLGPVITTNSVSRVIIANTTASTSNSTGALIVSGGLGVAGNTFLNNSLAAVTTTTSAVNYLQVTGNTTGGSPVLSAQGSDTDVSMNLTSKNVGSINFIVARGGNIPIVTMAAGSSVFGNPATPFIFSPTIPGAWGSKLTLPGDNTATIQTPDSSSMRFGTFGGTGVGSYSGNTQFSITHTGSAVNYLEVTGNTTGGSPVLSGQGSDTNINININPKGSGSVNVTGNLIVGTTRINTDRTITNYGITTNALGAGSGSRTIDLTLGNFVTANATGITTWTFSNPVTSPNACGFILELGNGGSATQTWPTAVRWPGGTAPTLTAAGTDLLVFITDDGGTNWRGVASMLDSK